MNSLKESMLLVKAKHLPICHLHSNFSLTLNSEHLMLTVRRKKKIEIWPSLGQNPLPNLGLRLANWYQFNDFWKRNFLQKYQAYFLSSKNIFSFFFFEKKNQLRLTKSSIFSAIYLAPHLTIEYCCIFHNNWFFSITYVAQKLFLNRL